MNKISKWIGFGLICTALIAVPLTFPAQAEEAEPIVEVDAYDFRINDFNRYLNADGEACWYLHDVVDQETTELISENIIWTDLNSIVEVCVSHGVDPSRYIHYHLDDIIQITANKISKGD